MSPVILEEVRYLGQSLGMGLIMGLGYGLLQLWRQAVRHGAWWIGLEDLLYWTLWALVLFVMAVEVNDGTIRWYTLAGAAGGMLCYFGWLHPLVWKTTRLLWNKTGFFRRFVEKLLKKRKESVTLKGEDESGAEGTERGRPHGSLR